MDDRQLIRQFLCGDDAAFEQLVRKYLKPVFNFVYRLIGDRSVAEDLTQVTFIKAWKNIHRFDSEKNFKVWLFAIAKNTTYDYFKKKKTIPFSVFTDEEGKNKLEEINGDAIFPDEILEREDIAKDLGEKLKKIPEAYRIILLMHYKDDFSLSEIAGILGLSYNTVKSQHNRALRKLKEVLLDNASEINH